MDGYPNLNLPQTNLKLEKENGNIKVFDILRKKFIHLTPEEWVRQHLIHYFIGALKYPKGLMKVERGYYKEGVQKRTDLVVYDTFGSAFLLLECKAPHIKINEAVALQAVSYNSVIQAKYIAISNGINHVCLQVPNKTHQKIIWLDSFPIYRR